MNISVLLRHSNVWVNEIEYVGYKSDRIVVSEHVTYEKLISTIAEELKIDETRKKIEARYIVEANACLLFIRNEMSVKLYVEIKKIDRGFGTYPLIITTLDKSASEMLFDGKVGAVMCCPSEVVEEIISYKSNSTSSMPLLDNKGNKIITDCKHNDVKFEQISKDKCTLILVMARFAIEHSFNYYAKRSDKKSYVLQYHSDDCVWVFKASCHRGTELFKVRFFQGVHTRPLKDQVFTQLQATVGFISGFAAPKLLNYKRIHTLDDIIEDIKNAFDVDINYQKTWRAKERVIGMLRGKPTDGHPQMARYVYMLNFVYPGSHIRMHKSEDNKFMYLFVALQLLKSGFEYCRPIVVVDGAHLSGAYKGTFVSVSTLDGASNLYLFVCIFIFVM
ncbi:uncharacterized protein LOC107870170 isoform X1 [Capsicum annuum]|uniref:uncharacterized protein LOC107870170 isoform X1 n=1 Tax=Capsicum annuum TaxID=4072 RepID=UPI001FB0FB1C|nr:uncharacterized protein LOC107870170 isoform X1 [Capsicum annuum]XP_047268389.1 uncharacterized protein LOC107870170 isoform X1 [Capsicum annuum]